MARKSVATLEQEIEQLQVSLDEAEEENDELRETLIQISNLAEAGDDDEEQNDQDSDE